MDRKSILESLKKEREEQEKSVPLPVISLKRRTKIPTVSDVPEEIKIKRRKILLKRRKKEKAPVLKRRPKKDVYYCDKKSIVNRLPFPIECSWVSSLYPCCRDCNKKIQYGLWKKGVYKNLARTLQERTYTHDSVFAKEAIEYNKKQDLEDID